MNLLILNYEYPPIGGGAGNQTKLLAEEFVKMGHKITIVTSHYKGLPFYSYSKNLEIIRVFAFRYKKDRSNIFQMLFYLFFAFPIILYLLTTRKIKFLHIHFLMPTGILGLITKNIFKIKYIITMHGGDVPSHIPKETQKYYKYLKWFADKIVKNSQRCTAVSEPLYHLAIKDFSNYNTKFSIIENGITINHKSKIDLKNKMTFIFIGRLSPEKNIFPIIKILSESNYDFNFNILGDGVEYKKISAYLKKRKDNRFKLYGWVNKNKITSILKISHFMLMNSKMEGLSIAALESMSFGIPVISSNCDGMKKIIINQKNGFLFRNELEFNKILKEIFNKNFNEKYIKLKNSTYEIVKEKYDIKKSAKMYIDEFSKKYINKKSY